MFLTHKLLFCNLAWSPLGCLEDVLRGRGHIDMGILVNAIVEASRSHRRRRHRVSIKENWSQEEDISLWKNEKGKYKKRFLTSETWSCIREKHLLCSWSSVVWFKHATPKYSFVTWMAMRGRLSTGDWNINVDASCVLCQEPLETADHLFFKCPYSAHIWEALMKGVMESQFTMEWETITSLLKLE